MADTNKSFLGNYELLEVLGDGAEGRVYKASCTTEKLPGVALGELVAVKRLFKNPARDNEPQSFRRQIEILSKLNHPNIVGYKDSFVWREKDLEEDVHCLVMELLDGEPLKALLEKNRRGLGWERARDILRQTLQALHYASQFGVTHRDLKPSNIHITSQGRPKLVDFGIARQNDGEATVTSSTAGAKGTFDYMAPDFAKDGKFRGDEQSDIFSFGIILYCTLAGSLPFPPLGEDANRGYFIRWLGQSPYPVVEFNHPVFRVLSSARACISRCIDPDRSTRFKTFAEVIASFDQITCRKLKHGAEVYEFTEWLGKGGFGEVFRARRVRDQRDVAIKRLFSAGQSARFVREAKILRAAAHPNLTEYVDFVEVKLREDEREFYLVLEFLEGMPGASLRERIKNTTAGLDPVETLQIFSCYLDCLEHLHRNGIIHRDIKPGNLYAPEQNPPRAKIFDLGIAHDEDGTRTRGQVPGTLDFMPPEFASQTSGRGSAQSDIYSLGVTLYQALTRRLPFPRLPKTETEAWVEFFRRAENRPACSFDHPVFQARPELIPLLQRSLAGDPQDRFPSAAEMRNEINGILLQWSLSESGPRAPANRDQEQRTEATLFVKSTAGTGASGIEDGTRATELQNLEQKLEEVAAEIRAAPQPPSTPTPPVDPADLERQRLFAGALQKKNQEASERFLKDAGRKAAEDAEHRKQEEAERRERQQLADAEVAEKKRTARERRAQIIAGFRTQAEQRLRRWTGSLAGFWAHFRQAARKIYGRMALAWQAAGGFPGLVAKIRRATGRVAACLAPKVRQINNKFLDLFEKVRQSTGKIAGHIARKWQSLGKAAQITVTASAVVLFTWGFNYSWHAARIHRQEKIFRQAVAQANADFKAENFPEAMNRAATALSIHPDDPALQKLVADSREQIELQASYGGVMKKGRRALADQNYTNALLWAGAALEKIPGDVAATRLQQTARQFLDTFHAATNDAQIAFINADYAAAEASADQALAVCKNDVPMQQLKAEAHNRFVTREAYRAALKNAQAAFDDLDYTNAVTAATEALRNIPGDQNATRLRDDAQKNLDDYHQAVNDAHARFKNADYAAAEENADAALVFYKNDAAMQQLKRDAHLQFINLDAYVAAMNRAQAALNSHDFTNALAQAKIALQKMPGEPAATRLRDGAQKNLDDYHVAATAASAAYKNADYLATQTNTDKALAIYPNDSVMQKLKASAQAQMSNREAYQIELAQAQAALDKHDFAQAVASAANALKKIPKDSRAAQIRDTAQQSLTAFTDAANQAQTDYALQNYAAALASADKALTLQTDNAAMQKLKTRILRQLDGDLVTLLQSFNVSVPLKFKYANVKKAGQLGPIGDAGKPYYRAQADQLEKIYRAGNWLNEDSRQTILQDLRHAIDGWQ